MICPPLTAAAAVVVAADVDAAVVDDDEVRQSPQLYVGANLMHHCSDLKKRSVVTRQFEAWEC